MISKPIVISFYTNDWEYPKHALRLSEECEKFQLEFCIEERSSTLDYIKNTAIKPFYIKECLEKFKRPVIWIDVDAIILKEFNLNFDNADILACKHMNSHVNREWAVAFLGFNYTPATLEFLTEWCIQTERKTDEAGFELTWQKLKESIKIETLPETYHFVKWSNSLEVPESTVICHQLSKFEDKLRRKNKGKLEEND